MKISTKNIFINCPYDKSYLPLLRPIIFTVKFLGFQPRLAMESADSGHPRIQRILNLIKISQYAIHDLSRLKATRRGEHFRLNMPFELGLDIGCRMFGKVKFKQKKCLVLEKNKHSLKKALSDLSNSDVCSHRDKPEEAVRHVRNWLVQEAKACKRESGTAVWYEFNDFMEELDKALRLKGFRSVDILHLPLPEFLRYMSKWIREKR